jgi:hypothetical protein
MQIQPNSGHPKIIPTLSIKWEEFKLEETETKKIGQTSMISLVQNTTLTPPCQSLIKT